MPIIFGLWIKEPSHQRFCNSELQFRQHPRLSWIVIFVQKRIWKRWEDFHQCIWSHQFPKRISDEKQPVEQQHLLWFWHDCGSSPMQAVLPTGQRVPSCTHHQVHADKYEGLTHRIKGKAPVQEEGSWSHADCPGDLGWAFPHQAQGTVPGQDLEQYR